MKKIIFQQGAISILLAILLLAELSVIGLGVSILMINQIKMSGQAGQSVVAFYAADAGAERCLYEVRKGTGSCPFTDQALDIDPDCTYTTTYNAGQSTITSLGQFAKTSRKMELSW